MTRSRSRVPTSPAAPPPPPAPTDLNVSTLEDALAQTTDGVIRNVPPTYREHIKRCIDAGLVEQAGEAGTWRLSDAGTAFLALRRARASTGFAGYRPLYLSRELLAQTMTLAVAAGELAASESTVFLYCWDRPSTIGDAVATLGLPRVFAEALQPGTFVVGAGSEPLTLDQLLKAAGSHMMPADLTSIACLAPGETHEVRGGGLLVRRVGEAPRQACSPFARRLANVLALYGKVLHGR
jgi:hypothetical protein